MHKVRFLKKQKILHLATIDSKGMPHLVPVWYKYIGKKFYIGTNTKTSKAKNIAKNNKICFCVDAGVWSPIDGMMGTGRAKLIRDNYKVKKIAGQILLRYFKTLKGKSAKQLLDQTNCVIEITPLKVTSWHY
ncbi:pyridoxamine 5'-phosphate oxidase family protein [Candidatus Nitrosotenuis cloacae]|uniref:Pyridoxamine 5'-phosphate oxidase n=1 Tax=Candidatus Nitrosotenuis cloacae TaxID=1603555 RepID=A0A3G1B3F0_9ARCH|nr:pyridoxamine 5'-phosphate oxidase family protein [Candidatus Nitrosotenuis cloacae]AJZ76180.1 pyridoxamine 5'-phosphate oxidase [Candidatus Nitrosotenuis cloacae]